MIGSRTHIVRAARIVSVLAAFLPLAAPATSAAWTRTDAPLWKPARVTWHSRDARFRDEMREVASAINHSGAKVRLVYTRSRRASNILLLRPKRSSECVGLTSSSWRGTHRYQSVIQWGQCPVAGSHPVLVAEARRGNIRLLLHEVLHGLSLNHEMRRCAVMNSYLERAADGTVYPTKCVVATGERAGYRYCRTLERDDQRGLVALYGGRRGRLPAATCPRRGLAPPRTIAATGANPGGIEPSITVEWERSPVGNTGVRVLPHATRCSTASEVPAATFPDATDVATAATSGAATIPVPAAGTYCVTLSSYVVGTYDTVYGRRATRLVDVPV